MNKLIISTLLLALVLAMSVTAYAHHMGPSQRHMGHHQGMMGQGMMGQGMMGQGMMGHGMMGHGMMGHGMMGHGMMGHGMNRIMAIHSLTLSDDQRKNLNNIKTELRRANWALKGAMMDHRDKLAALYTADNRDTSAILDVYGDMFKLKQQMIKNALDADEKAYALLNDDQRKKLK